MMYRLWILMFGLSVKVEYLVKWMNMAHSMFCNILLDLTFISLNVFHKVVYYTTV